MGRLVSTVGQGSVSSGPQGRTAGGVACFHVWPFQNWASAFFPPFDPAAWALTTGPRHHRGARNGWLGDVHAIDRQGGLPVRCCKRARLLSLLTRTISGSGHLPSLGSSIREVSFAVASRPGKEGTERKSEGVRCPSLLPSFVDLQRAFQPSPS